MEHKEIVQAIAFIRPQAVYTLKNNELTWLDETQTKPTQAEIQTAWANYNNWKNTPEGIKAELLERLGINQEEANLLIS